MKQAAISYSKNDLSKPLERMKRGETVTILDRTEPVAQLTPGPATGDTDWDRRLNELERRGIIRQGTGMLPDRILQEATPPATPSTDRVAFLREDRNSRP